MAHANIHRLPLLLMAVVLVVVASLHQERWQNRRLMKAKGTECGRRHRMQKKGMNVGQGTECRAKEQNAGRRAQSEVRGMKMC